MTGQWMCREWVRVSIVLIGLMIVAAMAVWGNAYAADQDSPRRLTSIQLIEAAQVRGELNREEAVILKVRAVKHPDQLPAEYKSEAPLDGKCAALVLAEAINGMDRFSPGTQATLSADLVRPSRTNFYDSPGGYFRIHYNVTGTHAVPTTDANTNGTPDYIENVAIWADSCWNREINTYGYLTPPSDGTTGGGSGLYDIYCEEMPYYGYCAPENPGPAPWNDFTSYLSIHRNFFGFPPNDDPEGNQAGAAKVTLAHEFFHAIQFAYDVGENGSWMEEGATWMEDEVYDLVNDNYNYLSDFFPYPQLALLSGYGLHMYAAFVWPRFLGETLGTDVIRAIWDSCKTVNAISAFESALVGYGSSRSDAFAEFTTWNWITGSRDDGLHYEEGSHYLLVNIMRSHNTYPVGPDSSVKRPEPLAANYVYFTPPAGAATRGVKISFNGNDDAAWRANVLARRTDNTYDVFPITLDAGFAGSVTVPDFGTYTHAVLIPANVSVNFTDNFTYSACIGPNPTTPLSPADGLTAGAPVTLEWDYDPAAVSYRVQVDDDSTFASPEIDSSVTGWNYTVEGLTEGATYYWRVSMTDACAESDWSAVWSFINTCLVTMTGDVNNDGSLTSGDIIHMVSYVFKGGAAPQPIPQAGDVNCDGSVSSSDIIYLVTHVFKGGPPPCDVCSIL